MTKQFLLNFFRNLILHCLDYAPAMPEGVMDHPDIKTLRSMQHAVNIIRSDYYSWFLTLISKIPQGEWKVKRLGNHVRCLNLDDKNEEFLLSCSLLVQLAHIIVMKFQCLNSINVAAGCLRDIFNKKYRVRFSEPDNWNEFGHYCEIILQRKRKFFRDTAALHESGASYQTNRKDIFGFWSGEEINVVQQASENMHSGESNVYRMYAKSEFNYHMFTDDLRRRLDDFLNDFAITESQAVDAIENAYKALPESNDSWTKNMNCPRKENRFCLGCFLTVSYPEVKNKELKILHEFLNSSEEENDVSMRPVVKPILETLKNNISIRDIDEDPNLKKIGDSSKDFSKVNHQDSRKVEISEDDSLEDKENPPNLDSSSGEHACTLEENSLGYKENPTSDSAFEEHTLTLKVDSIANVPFSEAKSAMRTSRFKTLASLENAPPSEDKTAITISEDQEELTKKKILSGSESSHMLLLFEGDKDPVASDELGPQEPEIALDSVQKALDRTHGTRFFKPWFMRIYYSEGMISFQEQYVCSICKTTCHMTFYKCLDEYEKDFKTGENFRSKIYNSTVNHVIFGVK